MDEPVRSRRYDATLEVLFDIKALIAKLVDLVEDGDDDGGEEAEEEDK